MSKPNVRIVRQFGADQRQTYKGTYWREELTLWEKFTCCLGFNFGISITFMSSVIFIMNEALTYIHVWPALRGTGHHEEEVYMEWSSGVLVKFSNIKCKHRKVTIIRYKTIGRSHSDYCMLFEVDRPRKPPHETDIVCICFHYMTLQVPEMLLALIRQQKDLPNPYSECVIWPLSFLFPPSHLF